MNRKRAQNEEEIKEAKLKFFIDISHEIRTPMTLIINPLEKLLAMDQDEKNHRLHLLMYRNAQRILHLINQLMDTRKIDKGQMVMHYRMTDMIGFINDIKMTFEDLATKKGIKFEFEHQSYSELYVWVDMQNFDKILMNLLSNAFKYTPDNGEITISITTGVDPTEDGPLKEYFEISVADTGIGINPEDIDKIFNRFYRVNNSLTSTHSGTGIGLHLCKSLVELHKGRIWAENRITIDEEQDKGEEKKGSIFIVRLPLGADHIKEEDLEKGDIAFGNNSKNTFIANTLEDLPIISDDVRKKARTNIRVLVVEDNPNINDYIKAELSDEFSIVSCTNGAEALQIILNDTPDIVVSDIMMPVMDGLTLTKKIRHNANVNHLPIVLLTSRTSVQEKLEGLDIGADAYIEKPFNTEMLKSTIASIVETRRMLRNKFTGAQDQKEKVKEIQIKSSNEELMERIMQVINANISNSELSVEKLSEMVGLSRVHLYRKIKDLTSMTAHDFIRSIRLKQAMELLEKKDLSISDIAYATGFTTVSHFSTAFKSMYGASPSEYRNRQKVSNNSSEAEQTE